LGTPTLAFRWFDEGGAMDRVAIVAFCWFALWIALGTLCGALLSNPGTGSVLGFFFALLATPAWPWVMPEAVNEWMDDQLA
jgi:hypothetical protein